MSFQAYLDTIKAKTGKTPEDFKALAAEKGLTKYTEVVAWLKADFGLGQGHANVIAQLLTKRAAVIATSLRARPKSEKAAIVAAVREHVWPLIATGQIQPTIDSTYPLSDAAAAHARRAAQRRTSDQAAGMDRRRAGRGGPQAS